MFGMKKKLRGQALLDSVVDQFDGMIVDLLKVVTQLDEEVIQKGELIKVLEAEQQELINAKECALRVSGKIEEEVVVRALTE